MLGQLFTNARMGIARCKYLPVIILPVILTGCPGAPPESWRSALYPNNWTPAQSAPGGAFLHDFSYAGYRLAEVPIPETFPGLNVFDVVQKFGADNTGQQDATTAIQSAIDAAQSAGGGIVRLPAGLYRCDGVLTVTGPRTVLQGAGAEATRLYFTKSKGLAYQSHITFHGAVTAEGEFLLATDGNPRDANVYLADASGLGPGDEVSVGWTITDEFVAEHGMTGVWTVSNGQWRSFFRRSVVAVDTSVNPHRVTLDAPLRYPAKTRDGASMRREQGYLTECGIENLAIANAVAWDDAWAEMQVHAIAFDQTSDCWIRNVISFESPHPEADEYHLQSSGILIVSSKRISVADCVLEYAQNRGGGGCGYLYEISRSSEVLVRDCAGRNGRHNFIQNWDFGTSGIVFLRCESSGSGNVISSMAPIPLTAYSEYHHSLAMACLVDSCVLDDGWYGGNRNLESSGAGHSVTQSVYWNTSGDGSIRSFQYGQGYIIGTRGVSVKTSLSDSRAVGTAPEDVREGIDTGGALEPRSLYEDQRARRLAKGNTKDSQR